ncbi:MAG TPA: hypothetical protein VLL54_22170 [Pyrinomonadaceae bacterium]|nr:hypothetical protein [Pyrinomonadaceae bacterium]
MHNCKRTKEEILDLALAESPVDASQMLQELNSCSACWEEFASTRSTLYVSAQALRSNVAAEQFWGGYHARLRSKIMTHAQNDERQTQRLPLNLRAWSAWKTFAASSIRLPAPVALAALLLLALPFVALLKTARATTVPAKEQAVVQIQKVEVPVMQEKIVTRVVYVEKKSDKLLRRGSTNSEANSDLPNSVATVRSGSARKALDLVGFKPTDQVQLKIIKGSYPNEK